MFQARRIRNAFPKKLEGRFTWKSSNGLEKVIEERIEKVTEPMNFVVRHFAREKLRFLLRPAAYFDFSATEDGMTVRSDAVTRQCFTDGRKTVFFDRREEETVTRCSIFGLGIQEYFYGETEGKWVHNFVLSEDGLTLFQTVFVDYPGFLKPLVITVPYSRSAITAR